MLIVSYGQLDHQLNQNHMPFSKHHWELWSRIYFSQKLKQSSISSPTLRISYLLWTGKVNLVISNFLDRLNSMTFWFLPLTLWNIQKYSIFFWQKRNQFFSQASQGLGKLLWQYPIFSGKKKIIFQQFSWIFLLRQSLRILNLRLNQN